MTAFGARWLDRGARDMRAVRIALISWVLGAAQVGAQVTFIDVGPAPGGAGVGAYGVSGEGTVVALGGTNAWRWTEAGGFQDLGVLPGGTGLSVTGVSDDGDTLVGWGDTVVGPGIEFHAVRWSLAQGLEDLGTPHSPASASAVSGDGSVVSGGSGSVCGGPGNQGYRWTDGSGWQALPACAEGWFDSSTSAVSADGSVIVGTGAPPTAYYRAFRWTAGGGPQDLGTLVGGSFAASAATGVSADGTTVVGVCSQNVAGGLALPFRWTAAAGMVDLGSLPGGTSPQVRGVSGDGSVIVGSVVTPAGTRAVVWTAASGPVDLNELLPGLGVELGGWELREAMDVSADGTTIVGNGVGGPTPGGGVFVLRSASGSWDSPWSTLGSGLAGVSGLPTLAGAGTLIGGEPVSLVLGNANPGGSAALVIGLSLLAAPFKGGTLVPMPDVVVAGLPVDGSGALVIAAAWPAGLPSGVSFWVQEWIVDPAGPSGFSASNAVMGTTP